MNDWISAREAAALLGVSRSTVYRSLSHADERSERWGDEGEGWRYKPLSRRKIFQVNRVRAELLAGATSPD